MRRKDPKRAPTVHREFGMLFWKKLLKMILRWNELTPSCRLQN